MKSAIFFLYRPLPPSACSQLLLLKPNQRLMLMLSMTTMTMDITLVMPTMDTTDTHMPTTVTTMARDPLMLSQRLMLMPSMDTTDTHMPTTVMPTTERDLLMLKPMLMLTTDTHTLTVTDMPTADTTDTHMLTDGESKMLTKS